MSVEAAGPFEGPVSGRRRRAIDLIVVLWVIGWITTGVFVGIDIWHLSRLSTTLDNAGQALQQTGNALQGFTHLPFVGHGVATISRQVEATGTSARDNALATHSTVVQLAYLLGMCIIVIPAVPTLAVYLPYRRRRRLETKALKRAMQQHDDAFFDEYLARRALVNLPYHVLHAVSDRPWRDVDDGHYERLASAELAWLGFKPGRRSSYRARA